LQRIIGERLGRGIDGGEPAADDSSYAACKSDAAGGNCCLAGEIYRSRSYTSEARGCLPILLTEEAKITAAQCSQAARELLGNISCKFKSAVLHEEA
jgi:hypothetical protein